MPAAVLRLDFGRWKYRRERSMPCPLPTIIPITRPASQTCGSPAGCRRPSDSGKRLFTSRLDGVRALARGLAVHPGDAVFVLSGGELSSNFVDSRIIWGGI